MRLRSDPPRQCTNAFLPARNFLCSAAVRVRGGWTGQHAFFSAASEQGTRPARREIEMTVISEPKPRKLGGETWTAAAVDLATATHLRAIAMLVVMSLVAFVPGFFQIPPVDRDEARFA